MKRERSRRVEGSGKCILKSLRNVHTGGQLNVELVATEKTIRTTGEGEYFYPGSSYQDQTACATMLRVSPDRSPLMVRQSLEAEG